MPRGETSTGAIFRRSRMAMLAGLLAVASCDRPPAAPPKEVRPATPRAAAPSPEEALAAAFAAAFPDGGLVGAGDRQFQFVARELVALPGGRRVAVLADGTGVGLNTCHACSGRLRITYLDRHGTGFAPIVPAIAHTIAGEGFGAPPRWTIEKAARPPVVTVTAGYTGQGCTVTEKTVWRLRPNGVAEDRAAATRTKDGCA